MSRAKPARKKLQLLSRENLSSIQKTQFEDVPVPDWDCSVRLKVLNGKERIKFETFFEEATKDGSEFTHLQIMTRLLEATAIAEDGKLLFSEEEWAELNANVLLKLSQAALKLNLLTSEGIREAEKN